VLNHPNALLDPLLLLCEAGRPVSFLAKEPLFRMPLIRTFVRGMDAIPVYRRQDRADMTQNRKTFAAARAILARGGSIGIFPEGRSHSEPQLMPFRTGAARIALSAGDVGGLHIVPAGLFYTAKTQFRSSALLCFGPAIPVAPVALGPEDEPPAEAVRALTIRLQEALGALTVQADRHEALQLVEATERIVVAAREDPKVELADRVRLRQRLVAGYTRLRAEAPDRLARVQSRIARYETALRQAELTPELLPSRGYRTGTVARVTAKAAVLLTLLLPLAVAGAVIHFPGWLVTDLVARPTARRHPDGVATVKAVGGLVFYPLTWVGLAVAAGLRWGVPVGLAVAGAAPLAGYAALRFIERVDWLAGSARGLLLALTGRRRFLRLIAERRAIREELLALAQEHGL
jgi:glycerol-3-phosphate O-acyltransferase / dihydroxyacetone phosphate acyltransferase